MAKRKVKENINVTVEGIMSATNFDTHKVIKTFKLAGFKEEQAEVIVQAIIESRDHDLSKLATKEQLGQVKEQVGQVKEQVELLKQQVGNIEKTMSTTMATKEDLAKLDASIKTWMLGLFFGIAGIIITIIFKKF